MVYSFCLLYTDNCRWNEGRLRSKDVLSREWSTKLHRNKHKKG